MKYQMFFPFSGAKWAGIFPDKNKECAKHIPAPSAVACDKSPFRASARPPGGFLYREQSFLYKNKESCPAGFSACGGLL
jgi:hypothetical protein